MKKYNIILIVFLISCSTSPEVKDFNEEVVADLISSEAYSINSIEILDKAPGDSTIFVLSPERLAVVIVSSETESDSLLLASFNLDNAVERKQFSYLNGAVEYRRLSFVGLNTSESIFRSRYRSENIYLFLKVPKTDLRKAAVSAFID